jgi:hypothetical protein
MHTEGQYADNSLESILNAQELRALFDIMAQPGWAVLSKVNERVKEDWINQTADMHFTEKDDAEMLRILRHRQGQITGVSLFLAYLEKKRLALQKNSGTLTSKQ